MAVRGDGGIGPDRKRVRSLAGKGSRRLRGTDAEMRMDAPPPICIDQCEDRRRRARHRSGKAYETVEIRIRLVAWRGGHHQR